MVVVKTGVVLVKTVRAEVVKTVKAGMVVGKTVMAEVVVEKLLNKVVAPKRKIVT